MALYYFHARYRGTMVSDDVPEEFSTVAEAENHAAIVASELGRNGGGPVTVFVYGERRHADSDQRHKDEEP